MKRRRFFGTDEFVDAPQSKVDLLIETAIRYAWRSRKPARWDDRGRRKPRKQRKLQWRTAIVILVVMYNLGIGYRDMEELLASRPKLRKRLELKKVITKTTIHNAYKRLDDVWFRDLNERIAANVEKEYSRRKKRR